jgi:hypothetical protein
VHGLYVIVDFHQDVWARMSGGDGAPGWTFEAAGLDFTKFDAADAAHVMQHRYDFARGGRQHRYPVMNWTANYRMPANGIMWTLFFAGRDFAPSATVGGEHVQDLLQTHYLGAVRGVAERLAGLDHVIGFDTLNEPGTGYIGRPLDERIRRYRGPAWSPLDGLAVASGLARPVAELEFGGRDTTKVRLMNPDGVAIWLPGRDDPFRAAGAWDVDTRGEAVALQPDFFTRREGKPVEIEHDHMLPFFHQVASTVRAVRDDWLLFAELDPFALAAGSGFPKGMPERTVNASHWYDIATLLTKTFEPRRLADPVSGAVHEGAEAIEAAYEASIGRVKAVGDRLKGRRAHPARRVRHPLRHERVRGLSSLGGWPAQR